MPQAYMICLYCVTSKWNDHHGVDGNVGKYPNDCYNNNNDNRDDLWSIYPVAQSAEQQLRE